MKINYKDVLIEFEASETKEVIGMVKAVGNTVKDFASFAAKDIANALEHPEMVSTINEFVKKEAIECVNIFHECRRVAFDKSIECQKYEARLQNESNLAGKFPSKFKVDIEKLKDLQDNSDGLNVEQFMTVLEIDKDATIAELSKTIDDTRRCYNEECTKSWERRKQLRKYEEFLSTLERFETKDEMLKALKEFQESNSED